MRAPASAPVNRFVVQPPAGVTLGDQIAFSPDGRTLVFTGSDGTGSRLYRRSFDALDAVPIRGTDGGTLPFFSPDGAWVGFIGDRAIKKVPLQGGTAATVVETASGADGATWLADDTIVFASTQRGLTRVSASGTNAHEITRIDTEHGDLEHLSPVAVPGDRAVAFVVHFGARDSQRIDAVSLASGLRTTLVLGNGARFLPSGHMLYQRGGTLWVAAFDPTRLALTGTPIAVVENIAIGFYWGPVAAVANSGALAYATGSDPFPPRKLIWVDRAGRETPIDAPPRSWYWPQVSPDGRRLGFHIMDPVNMDAWIYELDRGPLMRMTYDPRQDGYPLWTPDGKRIAFWSRQGGSTADLYLRSADMTGKDERLTTTPAGSYNLPLSWANGGKLLVFQQGTSTGTRTDIGIVPIEGDHKTTILISGPADEMHAAMSPNGRWIAYQSNVSGRWEVYVQPFPDLGGRWQVSTQGGVSPILGSRRAGAVLPKCARRVERAGHDDRQHVPVRQPDGTVRGLVRA